jgi:hypothetical protein
MISDVSTSARSRSTLFFSTNGIVKLPELGIASWHAAERRHSDHRHVLALLSRATHRHHTGAAGARRAGGAIPWIPRSRPPGLGIWRGGTRRCRDLDEAGRRRKLLEDWRSGGEETVARSEENRWPAALPCPLLRRAAKWEMTTGAACLEIRADARSKVEIEATGTEGSFLPTSGGECLLRSAAPARMSEYFCCQT